ncbi:MAG TPA: IS110 family transposase [Ktedonobacterales bacterium]|nr:IS110 family transposase [Ktedonobacterales bacterium]
MQVLYERCAGIDVHKKTVVVTILVTPATGQVQKQTRTFTTMTNDLLTLDDWLRAQGVAVVAMESTGVFWRPVFNLLEAERTIILVNAQHMKAVPGHKTDVKDSEWLAELLRHGLLKASFIPPAPIRALRELTRYRQLLIRQRADDTNRLQKVLETANIKLAAVATDILGASGRAMLAALTGGEQDAETLAELARGRLRAKLPQLRTALEGRMQPHQRFLLQQLMAHIDFLEASLAEVQREIEQQLRPFEEAIDLLTSVPAIQAGAAATILAEIGADMRAFPSHKHLASWAGLCPGNKQSAGKRLSGKTTQGNLYLRHVLCEVAWAVAHTKDNYLAAQYHRLARRRGKQKAILAVAHSLLVIIYHILQTKQPYRDLGADYFAQLDMERLQRRAIEQLEHLGYTVTLTPQVGA